MKSGTMLLTTGQSSWVVLDEDDYSISEFGDRETAVCYAEEYGLRAAYFDGQEVVELWNLDEE